MEISFSKIKSLYKNLLDLPEKVDGRYIQDSGTMFLTNPECIENYPI